MNAQHVDLNKSEIVPPVGKTGGIFMAIYNETNTKKPKHAGNRVLFLCPKKEDAMNYYVCKLKDGNELDFNKAGIVIQWDAGMFRVANQEGLVIAIVPVENVTCFFIQEEATTQPELPGGKRA